MESIKAPILYPEGMAPIVEPLQSSSPSPPRNSVTFDLPHRHPTRLSDIDEEKEREYDDASSSASWEDLSSNNMHADKDGKHVEGSFPLKKDYKEFHRAVYLGKLDILNEKLDLGLDIDCRTSTGFTALVIAIWEMQVDAVKLLLDRGADPHLRVNELPPLVHAASRTDCGPELVQLLMDHGAILTATSKPDHRNVLHCAAAVGTPETVEFLVSKAQMDLEKKCRRGCTPLLVAARAGNVENAKVLLRLGANLNALSLNGGSALIWSSCWENVDAIKFWLEQGVDINARDNNGRTSLFLACHYGSLETVTLLLENGADTSIPDSDTDEISSLMAAVLSDDPAIIKALAAHGCDLNYKNTEGETALDVAILGRRLKAIEALLELQGGEFYPKQSVALQIALSGGHEMVKSLITTVTLMYPYVAEHCSSDLGWLDWLLKEGGDLVRSRACFKILHVALEEQDIDLVTALAKQGCNFDVQLESGHTPLSFAVGHRNTELIQTLLDLGADINVPRANREELIYPFDDAILDMENGSDTEVVDLLLKSGRCRINQGKNPANTAFHYVLSRAAEMPHSSWDSLVLRMVDAAPDVNDDKCAIGCGLLHIATLRGREDIIDRLWLKGADLEATDKLGVTPLILACQHAPPMIPVLLARGANVNAKYKAEAGVLAAAASHGRTASLAELINKSDMDMEVKTESGYTPLACALTWAQERAALYLMHKGADVHWKTQPREQTALHFAAKYNLEVAMEQLLKKGLDVNARDSEGWMPLHEACALARPKLVRMLLDAGADIEAALPNADRPLHVALINEQEDIASLLVSRGASLTARASKNRTPLHLCAEYSLRSFGRSLLSRGVSTEDVDDETWTPLCCCADADFSNLLIKHGANVDYADKDNWTPLHQAVHNADYSVALSLLDAGANIDVRTTDDGLNVLERARDLPDRQTFERFVKLLEMTIRDREFEKARVLRGGSVEEEREERRTKSGDVEEVKEAEIAEVAEEAEDVGGQFEMV